MNFKTLARSAAFPRLQLLLWPDSSWPCYLICALSRGPDKKTLTFTAGCCLGDQMLIFKGGLRVKLDQV